MYTERSVELKSDFYTRYGAASGILRFERTGIPCVVMQSSSAMLAFAMNCGVRAYARQYGDILKIMNCEENIFNVSFVRDGCGAQILYRDDVRGLHGLDEARRYTIDKLLVKMGIKDKSELPENEAMLCDSMGRDGWCVYRDGTKTLQLPMPMEDYNVLVIRTQKNARMRADKIMRYQFDVEETERIRAAAEGLKRCRTEVLFDMINNSEKCIERLMSPSYQAQAAVSAAREADGVVAARICRVGIVCFVEKSRTDSAIDRITTEFEKSVGYSAGIIAVN